MPMVRLARSAAVASLLGLAALGCGDGSGRTNPVTTQQQKVSASESTPITSQTTLPVDPTPVFVPCALGGAGESVRFDGYLHSQFQSHEDGSGGFHVVYHVNPQGVSGVGLTSGETYRGTGVTQTTFHAGAGASTYTLVIDIHYIGQGRAANLTVHQVFHVTANANGELTALVGGVPEVECR
jgi:hypothetical protein